MRRAILAVLGTVAGTTVLVGLKAGLGSAPAGVATATTDLAGAIDQSVAPTAQAAPTNPASTAGARPSAVPTRAATPAGSGLHAGRFTGGVVQTKYGPVQVAITVAGGRMTDVSAVQLPSADEKSVQINQRAAPTLRQEALTAQSANINTVSGATYTSAGYRTSLQAALNAAKRG